MSASELGAAMKRMVDRLDAVDVLTAEQLNTVVDGLNTVALVPGNEAPKPADWSGLGAR